MLIVLAAFIAMGLASISNMRENIYDERKRSIAAVVDSALAIIDGFYKQYQRGEISENEAQRLSKEVLRTLRYEGDNYVWINDMESTMLMHPTNSELENTDVSAMEDANGRRVFPIFIETVKRRYLCKLQGPNLLFA